MKPVEQACWFCRWHLEIHDKREKVKSCKCLKAGGEQLTYVKKKDGFPPCSMGLYHNPDCKEFEHIYVRPR